jgi:hypothetical protein
MEVDRSTVSSSLRYHEYAVPEGMVPVSEGDTDAYSQAYSSINVEHRRWRTA